MDQRTHDIASLGDIVTVWAHPDDETYLTGGLMAMARALGARVTCISPPMATTPSRPPIVFPLLKPRHEGNIPVEQFHEGDMIIVGDPPRYFETVKHYADLGVDEHILFLPSDLASGVTGAVIDVDAGHQFRTLTM